MPNKSLLARQVPIANGDTWPLLAVALNLVGIERFLCGPPSDRESDLNHLRALRKASTDNSEIPQEYVAKLSQFEMVLPDRHVNPITKSIVCAALRGDTENNMYLVSPFLQHADRIMSDLIVCSTKAHGFLSAEQIAELLGPADENELGPWARLAKKRPGNGYPGHPN
jgi:hypothetical protein